MAQGWTAEVIERFERELRRLAADGNAQADAFYLDVVKSATLEEQKDMVALWRTLATSVVAGRAATVQARDLPAWQEVSDLLDTWNAQEGAPAYIEA